MKMYCLTLTVEPMLSNPHHKDVAGALATCWVLEDDPQSAFVKAAFNIRKYYWKILQVEHEPRVVTLEDFEGRDIGTEHFLIAQKHGIATAYAAWARDGKTSSGPIQLSPPDLINIESYLSKIRKSKRKGRCLHFDAGSRCTQIIDAHSIQKNGVLSLIAENGKVFAPSSNYGDLKRNQGTLQLSLQGMGKVSTFRGFCSTHDNDVFAPIDKEPIVPTREQVLLYAYRSICRELFIKEYSAVRYDEQAKQLPKDSVIYDLFEGMRMGTELGLKNLEHHKHTYDKCINARSFSDMRYVLFCANQKPHVVFSGIIYPDFDFLGRQLQDLADDTKLLDLLAFSFVPLRIGWGFLLAWHDESSRTCIPFMQSLATKIHEKEDAGELLFRFVIAGCENMAVNPTWWNALSGTERTAIQKTASYGADVLKMPRSDYLAAGLANVAGWSFEKVMSKMEPET